jgi:hypothetical protein
MHIGECDFGNSIFVDAEALINEAKRRRQRRYRNTGALLAAVGIIAGLVFVFGGDPNQSPAKSFAQTERPSTNLQTAAKPASLVAADTTEIPYTQLSVMSGKLIATDPGTGYDCTNAPVNLTTLQIETKYSTACAPNSVYYAGVVPQHTFSTSTDTTVGPVTSFDSALEHGPTSYDDLVRVAMHNTKTGQSTVGPVVMTFDGEVNTYQLEMAYGAGLLWLYDCKTPSGSKLVEVSATTGVVEQSVSMPNICRASVSANADGFFLTQDDESYGPATIVMYHVAPGVSHVTNVDTLPGLIDWNTTIDSSFWAQFTAGKALDGLDGTQELIRYRGQEATPQIIARDVESNDYSYGPVSGGGYEWTVQVTPARDKPTTYTQHILEINVASGETKSIGSFGNTLLEPGAGYPSIAYFHGSVYVLEGGKIYRTRT